MKRATSSDAPRVTAAATTKASDMASTKAALAAAANRGPSSPADAATWRAVPSDRRARSPGTPAKPGTAPIDDA